MIWYTLGVFVTITVQFVRKLNDPSIIRTTGGVGLNDKSTGITTQQQISVSEEDRADVTALSPTTSSDPKPDDIPVILPSKPVPLDTKNWRFRNAGSSADYAMKDMSELCTRANWFISQSTSLDAHIKSNMKNELIAFRKHSNQRRMLGWNESEKAKWISRLLSVRKFLILTNTTDISHVRGGQYIRIMQMVFDQ